MRAGCAARNGSQMLPLQTAAAHARLLQEIGCKVKASVRVMTGKQPAHEAECYCELRPNPTQRTACWRRLGQECRRGQAGLRGGHNGSVTLACTGVCGRRRQHAKQVLATWRKTEKVLKRASWPVRNCRSWVRTSHLRVMTLSACSIEMLSAQVRGALPTSVWVDETSAHARGHACRSIGSACRGPRRNLRRTMPMPVACQACRASCPGDATTGRTEP